MVLKRPVLTTPGSVWYYNGGLSQVLAGIVQEKTGKPLDKVAEDVLFTPLGIRTFEWIGGPMWNPAMPAAASGLRMRTKDLAKIGFVGLHDGKWKDRQIVPKKWLERSMQRHVDTIGAWSNGDVWGYGYQFWMGRFPEGYEVAAAKGIGDQNVFIFAQGENCRHDIRRVVQSFRPERRTDPPPDHGGKSTCRLIWLPDMAEEFFDSEIFIAFHARHRRSAQPIRPLEPQTSLPGGRGGW